MKRLVNYFKNGKGRGLRVTLIFTLLMALLAGGTLNYSMVSRLKEKDIQDFLNTIPEIKVENSTVVTPANTETVLNFMGRPFLTIQTNQDAFAPKNSTFIYLTRKNWVVFNLYGAGQEGQPQYKTYPLPENAIINTEYINNYFRGQITKIALVCGLVVMAILWILYFIQVFLTWLLTKLFFLKLNKGTVGRVATWTLIFFWVLTLISFFVKFGLPVITTNINGIMAPLFATTNMVYGLIVGTIILVFLRNKKETKKKG